MAELWLNIPQAVVLEATGDLERAIGLVETNPQRLIMRATLMLPPLGKVPLEADASEEEKQLALRELREKIEPQHSNRPYDVC